MVEFGFDLKQIFPQPIIRVQPHHLVPASACCKLSQILNSLGGYSAWAQGLRQPVTVAGKLAGDQVVYLIADMDSGCLAVSGLLKVGTKDLFLYDEKGVIQHCKRTPAILDFYVHESRQRRGLGKRLFERMLVDQGWKACQCSVDRPSQLMKAFLSKHYGLVRTIPQANNFVLYEGFFDDKVPAFSERVRAIFPARGRGGVGGGGEAGQRRACTSEIQLNQFTEPGHKRGQRLHGFHSSTGFQILPTTSSVADILGVGERINNRPSSRTSLPEIPQ